MKAATYVTWKAFGGTASSIEELRATLATIPRLQLVHACAFINSLLQTWQGQVDVDQHAALLKAFFSPRYAVQLDGLARRADHPEFVFHRQQLLFLIRESLSYSSDGPDLEKGFNERFAQACLRANDLMHHGLALNPQMTQVERLLPELVTVNEYTVTYDLIRRAARARICIDDILTTPQIQARPEFVDIAQVFSAAAGISVREYFNLTLGILAKYLKLKPTDYANVGVMRFARKYFRSTPTAVETIDRYLKDVSGTLEEIRIDCLKSTRLNDFTPLRRKPILKVNDDSYFAVDAALLADKLDTGVFWRVSDHLPPNERDNLHNLWGLVFHEYVQKLLLSTPHCGRLISCPRFEDGSEVCDGMLLYGSTAVLMEYKGSMLTADSKYSGNPDALINAVNRKFVGTEESQKGVGQLANSLVRLGNKKSPERIVGLDTMPRRLFPVLIGRETALGSPFMNRYLNDRFSYLYNRKLVKPTVTPLFVLTIDEVEHLVPYLDATPMYEILEARYAQDRSLTWPLSSVSIPILNVRPSKEISILDDRANQIFDEVCQDFFGKPFNEMKSESE